MKLPVLHTGKRFTLPRPIGSADAVLLAQLAEREKAEGKLTAIVVADTADAQRLMDEMVFFAPGLRCVMFPDWETLPYDTFSPHQDLISERLATLWRIRQRNHPEAADVVLVPATTALYRLAPPSFLAGYTFEFKVKQKLDEAQLKSQLTLAGYNHVSQVVSPGEYAVRGGLIDLFPMGSPVPYRVDLFDDEIDSIRTFDPDSQRSLYPVPEVRLLPGREFPMDEAARARFRSRWRELLEGDPTKSRIYKDMGNGVATAGIEYYLPLFFEETATVFDYLDVNGQTATLVLHGELEPAFQHFWQDTKERHRLVHGDPERPVLPPEALFLSAEQFYAQANAHAQLSLRPGTADVQDNALAQSLPELTVVRAFERNDTPRVQAFFTGFLAEEAALDPASGETGRTEAPANKVSLENLAAPGRAKSAAATNAPAEKPIFTRAQIAKFYADAAAGKFKGRDAERDRLERQIFEAEREGRIR